MSLSIGQVAERTGLSVHALRFYEKEGILANEVHRGPGGRRVYTQQDVDWLRMCIMLRMSGMPVPEIRRYTELVRQGDGNELQRLEILKEHQERVRQQMAQLQECMDLITYKVGIYEDYVNSIATRAVGQ
ncbi:DNA-binding transcriptional MerR regulator [Lentzea atacamensis]|uniref:DNA-binding transcriptional MerR regulator n=2 Tax=Lentzea TaxID=165301 RepID=A0A316HL99_9PSEU|nr:MerR family transcriptional regulator [Lentzea atacamensis]PWK81461.1 DNA-binding transcriptional MerR regulator [Lentzea atacamensis]RAS70608.1 DNA-binding transcriptional MerR regulator [Lentzea atacamensis]